ncbi:NAD(P)/FAD-dependent oxidoreductase [Halotalea alkalilenta]|uniref:D-amino-acid oxidase n=1 Tax=Halotalea alkalilenta TaxID=376489 RepID=A0A172YCA4_9GAMM|nr:FAD-binding oxidoreductase [Halotalea alkalilenta]ANF56880.1 D-amino-acid oxidase [Halotalea alkalilenta]
MGAHVEAVRDSVALAQSVDVVVIGGGIVGTAAAYELARKGVSVALLEKGRIGAEQSSRNWGWCRQQNRDFPELPLSIYSLRRWEELGAETGRELGFRRSGLVYASTKAAELATWEAWIDKARAYGFVSHMLSSSEAKQRTPGSTSDWLGGLWSPSDGRAEPSLASPALAAAGRDLGAFVHQNCAVRGLDISAGRVTGVWTERGLIKAQKVICAGGAWSSRFCRRHGIDLPNLNVTGTALKTTVAAEVISGGLATPGFALRRRLDGAYSLSISGRGRFELTPQGLRHAPKFRAAFKSRLARLKYRVGTSFFSGPEALGSWAFDAVSPFERHRVLDPRPDQQMVEEALTALVREYPALAGIKAEQAWGGLIDSTPDIIPVISPVDQLPGFIIASGFSGHGFGIGPGAGRLIADLAVSDTPIVDPAAFRLERFSDGSEIRQPKMM